MRSMDVYLMMQRSSLPAVESPAKKKAKNKQQKKQPIKETRALDGRSTRAGVKRGAGSSSGASGSSVCGGSSRRMWIDGLLG